MASSVDQPPDSSLSSPTSPDPSTGNNSSRPKPKTAISDLPPLLTNPAIARHSTTPQQKPISLTNKRLSTFSIGASSNVNRSRPQSTSFPIFHSSLEYALVRDFAYQPWHPLHYGPPPGSTPAELTPLDEVPRRLSEPSSMDPWDEELDPDDASFHGAAQLPARSYGDGPPWREDEDLHSPVVTSSKHKKGKASANYFNFHSQPIQDVDGRRTSYAGTERDGSQVYYVSQAGETSAGGPGGEFITYASNHEPRPRWPQAEANDEHDDTEYYDEEDSRYSKDYTFSIASPDEEMHGKAVALFDFARENDNELPLVEGQVLWVSYRHGQGWLVAQDPKSGESGLVPEAYVRLLRDIEGGLNGLNGQGDDSPVVESDTPTGQRPPIHERSESNKSTGSGQHYETPVISHFSTSSKDLQPYPSRFLGSQANTPVVGSEATFSDKIPVVAEASSTSNQDSKPVDETGPDEAAAS